MNPSSTPELSNDVPVQENQNVQPAQSQPTSQEANKATIKGLLGEARATRDVLVGFRAAVEGGTYHGSKMMDIAKGVAFLDAILGQNQGHIKNLQEKLEASNA